MAGNQGKKSSKADRSRKSPQNLRYKNERRHEKSHVRRITHHLIKFGADKVAQKALAEYKIKAGVR